VFLLLVGRGRLRRLRGNIGGHGWLLLKSVFEFIVPNFANAPRTTRRQLFGAGQAWVILR